MRECAQKYAQALSSYRNKKRREIKMRKNTWSLKTLMSFGSSLLAALLITQSVLAAGLPENIKQETWVKIVTEVGTKGTDMAIGDGQFFRSVGNFAPDEKSFPRQSEYLTLMGYVNSENQFAPYGISAVSENWSIVEKGNIKIDQWIYVANLQGKLLKINHFTLLEDAGGRVLEHNSIAVGQPEDKENVSRWGAKLEEWSKRLVK